MAEKTDSATQYFKTINRLLKSVPREEMFSLWKRAKKGSTRAKKRLLELNLRLVVPIAKRYCRPGTDLMDLIEEGNLGLLNAVEKFEPKRGYRFSTYATYWIEQRVRREAEEKGATIKIPSNAWENFRKWLKQWDKLYSKFGRDPSISEMARAIKWSERRIKSVIESSGVIRSTASLTTPMGNSSDTTLGDTITDLDKNTPDDILLKTSIRNGFKHALNLLNKRERKIIQLRYGLNETKLYTLEEIGKKLKLSRERVRQLANRALLKFKRQVHKMGLIDATTIVPTKPSHKKPIKSFKKTFVRKKTKNKPHRKANKKNKGRQK
ncbi:MAG TPA: sigma-70 family RNA polymerase sigma factor [Elusimicrobiales bacterium]|nr:sigma-70 family RNA polymerase sigma factor [Elusimicrobiales bacterium]